MCSFLYMAYVFLNKKYFSSKFFCTIGCPAYTLSNFMLICIHKSCHNLLSRPHLPEPKTLTRAIRRLVGKAGTRLFPCSRDEESDSDWNTDREIKDLMDVITKVCDILFQMMLFWFQMMLTPYMRCDFLVGSLPNLQMVEYYGSW